ILQRSHSPRTKRHQRTAPREQRNEAQSVSHSRSHNARVGRDIRGSAELPVSAAQSSQLPVSIKSRGQRDGEHWAIHASHSPHGHVAERCSRSPRRQGTAIKSCTNERRDEPRRSPDRGAGWRPPLRSDSGWGRHSLHAAPALAPGPTPSHPFPPSPSVYSAIEWEIDPAALNRPSPLSPPPIRSPSAPLLQHMAGLPPTQPPSPSRTLMQNLTEGPASEVRAQAAHLVEREVEQRKRADVLQAEVDWLRSQLATSRWDYYSKDLELARDEGAKQLFIDLELRTLRGRLEPSNSPSNAQGSDVESDLDTDAESRLAKKRSRARERQLNAKSNKKPRPSVQPLSPSPLAALLCGPQSSRVSPSAGESQQQIPPRAMQGAPSVYARDAAGASRSSELPSSANALGLDLVGEFKDASDSSDWGLAQDEGGVNGDDADGAMAAAAAYEGSGSPDDVFRHLRQCGFALDRLVTGSGDATASELGQYVARLDKFEEQRRLQTEAYQRLATNDASSAAAQNRGRFKYLSANIDVDPVPEGRPIVRDKKGFRRFCAMDAFLKLPAIACQVVLPIGTVCGKKTSWQRATRTTVKRLFNVAVCDSHMVVAVYLRNGMVLVFPWARTVEERDNMPVTTHPERNGDPCTCCGSGANQDCIYWLCKRCCVMLGAPCKETEHRRARMLEGKPELPGGSVRLKSIVYHEPGDSASQPIDLSATSDDDEHSGAEGRADPAAGNGQRLIDVTIYCEHRWEANAARAAEVSYDANKTIEFVVISTQREIALHVQPMEEEVFAKLDLQWSTLRPVHLLVECDHYSQGYCSGSVQKIVKVCVVGRRRFKIEDCRVTLADFDAADLVALKLNDENLLRADDGAPRVGGIKCNDPLESYPYKERDGEVELKLDLRVHGPAYIVHKRSQRGSDAKSMDNGAERKTRRKIG
ncbi:hypothetical protein AURDEDRAFT_131645, partial [Auricularia subglabra TFB-10046 SS5]